MRKQCEKPTTKEITLLKARSQFLLTVEGKKKRVAVLCDRKLIAQEDKNSAVAKPRHASADR